MRLIDHGIWWKEGHMFSFGLYRKKEQPYDSNAQSVIFGFSGAVISDIGCMRARNEDNFVFERNMNWDSADRCKMDISFSKVSNEWHVACIFDGMGGGERGEVASKNAAEVFLDNLNCLAKSQTKAEVDLTLRKAFLEANNRILTLRNEYPIQGTTATVFCSNGTEFKIYYLGDTRAYLARGENVVIYETLLAEGVPWGRTQYGWVSLEYIDMIPTTMDAVDVRIISQNNTPIYSDLNKSTWLGSYKTLTLVLVYEYADGDKETMARTDLGWVQDQNFLQ